MEAADFHLPLPPRLNLAHVFCLEEQRVVGNDWVVRYANRALQIVPTRHAKRFIGPKARVLVRETEAGELLLVARSATGAEHVLEWTPAIPTARAPERCRPSPAAPTPPLVPPAGYTRAGRPLTAKQMAMRNQWSKGVTSHMQRKAARAAAQEAGSR